MSLAVAKLRDGWAVLERQEALVRGLRERSDAFKIRSDILRKGWFQGVVTFARNGKALEVRVPADAGDVNVDQIPPYDAGEGTVDDL